VTDALPETTRRARVVIADDTDSVRALFRKLLTSDGHEVIATADGAEALDAVQKHKPDLVLLDVGMPHLDGLEVCRRLKSDAATSSIPVLLVTGQADMSDRIKGIEAGADEFISKPVHPHELRARVTSLTRMKHLVDAVQAVESAFVMLARTIDARDPNTQGRGERLAVQAAALGRALGRSTDDLDALHRGARLHDIGKVGVPDAVLLKPGTLTAEEFEMMTRHTILGDSLCAPLASLQRLRPIIRSHHERLDGSGYPDGLRGDAVPVLAHIVGIVDIHDALISTRPHRPAMTRDEAAQVLREEAGQGKLSPEYVDAFLASVAGATPTPAPSG
jgi:putative two-component system response regulator